MLKVITRKKKIKKFLYDEYTRNYCRLDGENTFVRNRKIIFTDLLLITLNNKAKTTSMEIRDYELNVKGKEKVNYTDEAYLKQRRHLNPRVFKEANRVFINSFYNESKDAKTYKGYYTFAIDGSKYEVPNTPQNREHFGIQTTQHERQPARANISTIYDLNNYFYLDLQLEKYNFSEKTMAKRNIEEVLKTLSSKKIILVMDRNYISLEFMLWLNERNIKYIFRLQKTTFKNEISSMETNDEYVNIIHTYPRLQSIRKNYPEQAKKLEELKKTKVRITKNKIKDDKELVLLSNLSMEEFSEEEIKQLYIKRWNIESSYNCLKNKLFSESFTGNLPIIIEQDLYAHVLIYNQMQDMINESNEKLKLKNKKTKLEYKVNENKAIGIFKDKFIKIILISNDKKSEEEYDKLMEEMTNYVSAIRLNRESNQRNFNRANKYKTNMKRSF